MAPNWPWRQYVPNSWRHLRVLSFCYHPWYQIMVTTGGSVPDCLMDLANRLEIDLIFSHTWVSFHVFLCFPQIIVMMGPQGPVWPWCHCSDGSSVFNSSVMQLLWWVHCGNDVIVVMGPVCWIPDVIVLMGSVWSCSDGSSVVLWSHCSDGSCVVLWSHCSHWFSGAMKYDCSDGSSVVPWIHCSDGSHVVPWSHCFDGFSVVPWSHCSDGSSVVPWIHCSDGSNGAMKSFFWWAQWGPMKSLIWWVQCGPMKSLFWWVQYGPVKSFL